MGENIQIPALQSKPTPVKVHLRQVSKAFSAGSGTVEALGMIDLEIREKEFLCIVGPSGCGKSTLLNLIAGLEKPDTGEVWCNGSPIAGPGPDRVVIFQEPALFPWLTVLGNVEFGLRLRGEAKASRR